MLQKRNSLKRCFKKKLSNETICSMTAIQAAKNTSTSSCSIATSWSVTPPYGNTICPHQYNILIHNTSPHTVCKMRHRTAHRNTHKHQVRADTHTQSAHTQTHTQFSWCNDPFGIEQHLFSKWRLVVGMLVIFSLTQWANREGRILFRTYNQWPVLSQHFLVILVSPVTTTHTHTHRQSILKES